MALIMLVIISFVGLLAARNAANVEQFSNNMRTTQVSRQSAELALRYCEQIAIAYQSNKDGGELDSTYSTVDINKISVTEVADATDAAAIWKAKANWKATTNLITVTPNYGTSVNTDAKLGNNPTCLIQAMTNGRYLITTRGLSSDAQLDSSSGELKSGSEVWLQSILVPSKPLYAS